MRCICQNCHSATIALFLALFLFGCSEDPVVPDPVLCGTGIIEENVVLESQKMVDSIEGVTEIGGSLWISGSDIHDLTPLKSLRIVGGSIWISGNDVLATLAPLEGLADTIPDLGIRNNKSLLSLEGLGNLTLKNSFAITLVPMLTDLNGIPDLSQVVEAIFDLPPGNLDFTWLGNAYNINLLQLIGHQGPGVLAQLDELPGLKRLKLSSAEGFTDLALLSNYPSLEILEVSYVSGLRRFGPLQGMNQLRFFAVTNCDSLQEIGDVEELPSLEFLGLAALPALSSLNGFGGLPLLDELRIYNCPALPDLSGMPDQPALDDLLLGMLSVDSLDGLPAFPNLTRIRLKSCDSLKTLGELPALPSLLNLSMQDLPSLVDLNGMPDLPNLMHFTLMNAESLTSLEGMPDLPNLVNFELSNAISLVDLQEFPGVPWDAKFIFTDLEGLTSMAGLNHLNTVGGLSINGCENLRSLTGLENLVQNMGQFTLNANRSLTSIDGLVRLQGVNSVRITWNSSLDQCTVLNKVLDWNVQGSIYIDGNGPCE